jgi:glycosyltransferase involved in cell wall biosynthesis
MTIKKICFVVNEWRFFASHRMDLAISLSRTHGHQVVVITSIENALNLDLNSCKDAGIQLIHLEQRKVKIGIIKYLIKLRKLLINGNFDHIFFITLELSFFGALLKIFTKLGTSTFVISGLGHDFLNNSIRNKCYKFIQLAIFRLVMRSKSSQGFIFQNIEDAKLLQELMQLKETDFCVIRGNGIDTEKFNYIERSFQTVNFCYAGRLTKSKGIKTMIEAFRGFKDKFPQSTGKLILCILSDVKKSKNDLGEAWLAQAIPHKDIETLYNLNAQELVTVLHRSQIFILPSMREGISKAALEAASTGLPIIASDAVGARDCVLEGINGHRFNAGEAEDLMGKIENLAFLPTKLHTFSVNSRKMICADFGLSQISREYNALINSYNFQ